MTSFDNFWRLHNTTIKYNGKFLNTVGSEVSNVWPKIHAREWTKKLARNSVEIAWTNEQKVIVTSYGRNKNLDDEIKNKTGTFPQATRNVKTSQKTVIAAEAITFCIKPLNHYLCRSDLKNGEI